MPCGRLAWGGDGTFQEALAIRPSQPPPSGIGIHRAVRGSFLDVSTRRAVSLVCGMRPGIRVSPQQLRATDTGLTVAGACRSVSRPNSPLPLPKLQLSAQ